MSPTDKKLYELLGSKELTFGCLIEHNHSYNPEVNGDEQLSRVVSFDGRWALLANDTRVDCFQRIGHEPTIVDLHRWFITKSFIFSQNTLIITVHTVGRKECIAGLNYDAAKPLLLQEDSTKLAIIKLIESFTTK